MTALHKRKGNEDYFVSLYSSRFVLCMMYFCTFPSFSFVQALFCMALSFMSFHLSCRFILGMTSSLMLFYLSYGFLFGTVLSFSQLYPSCPFFRISVVSCYLHYILAIDKCQQQTCQLSKFLSQQCLLAEITAASPQRYHRWP